MSSTCCRGPGGKCRASRLETVSNPQHAPPPSTGNGPPVAFVRPQKEVNIDQAESGLPSPHPTAASQRRGRGSRMRNVSPRLRNQARLPVLKKDKTRQQRSSDRARLKWKNDEQ
ncbi:hypothetical protein QQF64_016777 [Cirrhinus molitorella]|uniref:Uncharacterized protein n=1 Tax=Cirrhinus molitorella TaxID=172907 RepID=A0ABR3LNT6_9TELE